MAWCSHCKSSFCPCVEQDDKEPNINPDIEQEYDEDLETKLSEARYEIWMQDSLRGLNIV